MPMPALTPATTPTFNDADDDEDAFGGKCHNNIINKCTKITQCVACVVVIVVVVIHRVIEFDDRVVVIESIESVRVCDLIDTHSVTKGDF